MQTLLSLLGYIGVFFMLLAYFLLVTGQFKATDTHHFLLNVLGAFFIMIAMYTGAAVPVLLAPMFWLVISLFGLWKHHAAITD